MEEAMEKISFLGSVTPDILKHREELTQVVGEEISRIIHEQKELEERHEHLIAQRSALKGITNKAALKENQREIQEVSRQLRESTKSLCRNLKENPNFAGNLLKVQHEREALLELLDKTLKEIKQNGTFESLQTFVSDEKNTQAKAYELLRKEKEAVDEVKRLTTELGKEKAEHQKETTEYRAKIMQLKEQLVAVKAKAQIDTRYAKNEAKAKRSSTARMYRQLLDEQKERIEQLEAKRTMEDRVHEETVKYLTERQEELQTELADWTNKYDEDTQVKQQQLQDLREQRESIGERLEVLERRWQDEMTAIRKKEEERKRLADLEVLRKEEMKAQNTAARMIQSTYRAYLERKEAKRKELDTGKKKKGKKGGKKKGKK